MIFWGSWDVIDLYFIYFCLHGCVTVIMLEIDFKIYKNALCLGLEICGCNLLLNKKMYSDSHAHYLSF